MKKIVHLFLFLIPFVALAQRGSQMRPIYVEGTSYKNTGWFIGPGFTYMLPENRNQNLTMYTGSGDALDTLYSGDFNRRGKIGLYLELGRHHFVTSRSIIDHYDYGVHFKMLRGRESFSGISAAGAGYALVENSARYSESFAGAFFNASHIFQLTNNKWIQASLGANVEYRVLSNRSFGGASYANTWQFPEPLLAQVHFKLGYGWRPEPGIYILPMVETPVITGYPWDGFKSTLPYYSGRIRPLIFTLRIQWLSKRPARECEGQPGKMSTDVDKENPGKRGSNSLWGNEGKKMDRKRRKNK